MRTIAIMNAGCPTGVPSQLGWSPRSVRLGQWSTDIVRVFVQEDLARLQEAVNQSIDMTAQAYDDLNATKDQIDELQTRKDDVRRTFGPMPNEAAEIASVPLVRAENALRTNLRNIAALDVLFFELAYAFSQMGNSMQTIGMTSETNSLRRAAQAMRDWRSDAARDLYSRMDVALDDREAIERDFKARLMVRGLRHIQDSDKPGYFNALGEAVSDATGVAIEGVRMGMSGSQTGISGHYLGMDPITGLILVIGALLALGMLIWAVRSEIHVDNGAAAAALERAKGLNKMNEFYAEELAKGRMTPDEVRLARIRDAAATRLAIEEELKRAEADAAAAKNRPNPLETVLYGTLSVGGLLLLLKVFKVF